MLYFGIVFGVVFLIFVGVQIIRYLDGSALCKHDWEILSETTTKSKFEHSVNVAGGPEALYHGPMPHQLVHADRKHIQIVTCKKCGKLKRFVTDI